METLENAVSDTIKFILGIGRAVCQAIVALTTVLALKNAA
jgi:hypothetical protein